MSTYGGTPRNRKERKVSILLKSAEGDKKHCSGIESVICDSEHKSLFTGSRDASIRRWSLTSPTTKLEAVYEGHADWVNDMVLVNDLLISCSNDKTVRVWRSNSQGGTLLSTLTHHSDYVKCVAASPVRNVAASAGLRGEIFLVDLKTGSTVHLYPTKAGGSQVSPNDSGVGAVGGIACFAANPQQQQSSTEPKGSIYSLAMQATGGLLAAGSTDHAVRLWDPRTFTKVGKLRGHTDLVRTLLIKEDGTQLLSGSSDSTIKLWDLGMQRCIQTYSVHSDSVWSIFASDDFNMVYSGGRDKAVYRTNLATRAAELLFHEKEPIRQLALCSNTSTLWAATSSSSLNKWTLPDAPQSTTAPSLDRHSFMAGRVKTAMSSSPLIRKNGAVDRRPKEAAIGGPSNTIVGIPPIVEHKVMTDRHHVLTRDAEGTVALWNVLAGSMVDEYGKVDFDAKEKELFEPKSLPSWFSCDHRLGQLCVTLDFLSTFSAEEYAIMLGCKESDDCKINFGKVMLEGAFASWRRKAASVNHSPVSISHPTGAQGPDTAGIPGMVLADPHSQGKMALPGRAVAVVGKTSSSGVSDPSGKSGGLGEDDEHLAPVRFWRLPPLQQPAVICQLASGQQWFRPISQFTGAELEPDEIPTWVGDVVMRDVPVAPKEAKYAFVLMPAEGSNMPLLPQSKLTAPRILQIHKVANYCILKLMEVNITLEVRPVYSKRPSHITAPDLPDTPGRPTLELLCNGMGVPYEMSLAAVKKYIWKKPDDLIFHFRIRDPAKLAPLPVIKASS